MARYDDSQPYTPDYDEDCAYCGKEYPRGELAWSPAIELECADCERKRIQRTNALGRFPARSTHNAEET